MYKILVLNLGATSSKVSIYEDLSVKVDSVIRHSKQEMQAAPLSRDQVVYRKKMVLQWLADNGEAMENFDAVAARGATTPEANQGGTYLVDGKYRELLLQIYIPDEPPLHGNRIITPLALSLTEGLNIPIYVTDPTSVDEMTPKAKLSGLKGHPRRSCFHALNHRIVARKHAAKLGKPYPECRFVVAHMGGGISVGAHENGLVVDAGDTAEGYGPFSPERSGTISTGVMMELCYRQEITKDQFHRLVRGNGGLASHLGTSDLREVEARVDSGDQEAQLVMEAMFYQIIKEIGSYAAVLKFELDSIILTGGLAYSRRLVSRVEQYVGKLAPVAVYPGEFENEALAAGAYRVLSGQEKAIVL
ncbi:MAG: butyrate kinase [Deltaproteobacteria bacterium]|jgi:butyrate kinase|nr:butyrate kinase [Deltaproteobacteria bacterium]